MLLRKIAHRCPSYQHFLAGRCFKCTSGNCAVMGYHASMPHSLVNTNQNSSENEITDIQNLGPPQPGKYFLVTGKDYPFCRKF